MTEPHRHPHLSDFLMKITTIWPKAYEAKYGFYGSYLSRNEPLLCYIPELRKCLNIRKVLFFIGYIVVNGKASIEMIRMVVL